MVARVKRRWYQFSLRTLFIAFTLVSIVLVACIDLAPAQRQAVAVNRVYALGGDLWLGQRVAKGSWILNQLRSLNLVPSYIYSDVVEGVFLGDKPVTDGDLRIICGLPEILYLRLSNTEISDQGVTELRRLTDLQELNVAGTELTDAGLDSLKDLVNLRELDVRNTKVTDRGISGFQKAMPNCVIIR